MNDFVEDEKSSCSVKARNVVCQKLPDGRIVILYNEGYYPIQGVSVKNLGMKGGESIEECDLFRYSKPFKRDEKVHGYVMPGTIRLTVVNKEIEKENAEAEVKESKKKTASKPSTRKGRSKKAVSSQSLE